MEFSIFNVRLALKKDFFTFDNLKLTLPIWWAFFWRSFLALVALSFVAGFVAYFTLNALGLFLGIFIIAIAALPLSIYISARLHYYALFEKEYKTVTRVLAGEAFAFLSWAYWKRLLLTFAFSFVVGLIVNLPLQILFGANPAQDFVIGIILNILLWNTFLLGGTWNFIPAPRLHLTQ